MLNRLKKFFSRFNILLNDWLRYVLIFDRLGYLRMKNRMERIAEGPMSNSYVCLWPYTSRLSAVEQWPFIGRYLLRRVCLDNDFILADQREQEDIDVSVIIGHRGTERLGLLLATLRSFAAQERVRIECIVIEQDSRPRIEKELPDWVRYFFQEAVSGKEDYNRSAAFNLGARHAQGDTLLLHDNDMIVPSDYCLKIRDLSRLGYEAINIKRFVFYLNQNDSRRIMDSIECLKDCTPVYVVQNLEAGGSVAINKDAYFSVGGMDERFIGWGGEDNEFWERCGQLKRWIWGFAPIIHLWHESQPLKLEKNNLNIERARGLKEVGVKERITMLKLMNNYR
jgi:GT2 family glycosyltransferase